MAVAGPLRAWRAWRDRFRIRQEFSRAKSAKDAKFGEIIIIFLCALASWRDKKSEEESRDENFLGDLPTVPWRVLLPLAGTPA